MTRKTAKTSRVHRECSWKSKLMKRSANDEKEDVKNILVEGECAKRWSELKTKFSIQSDAELLVFLLELGEAQGQPSSIAPGDISGTQAKAQEWSTSKLDEQKNVLESTVNSFTRRRSTRNGGTSKADSDPNILMESTEDSKKGLLTNSNQVESKQCNNETKEEECVSKKRTRKKKEICDMEDKTSNARVESAQVENILPSQSDTNVDNDKDCCDLRNGTKNLIKASKKSFHKDRWKWKQLCAADLDELYTGESICGKECDTEHQREMKCEKMCHTSRNNNEHDKVKCNAEVPTVHSKERKIFKVLHRNRIKKKVTDVENKLPNGLRDVHEDEKQAKESELMEEENRLKPAKHQENEPDKTIVNSGDTEKTYQVQGDVHEAECPDTLKLPKVEPVFIEVGERVKLKKRKKSLSQEKDSIQHSRNGPNQNHCHISSASAGQEKPKHKRKKHKRKNSSNDLNEIDGKLRDKMTEVPNDDGIQKEEIGGTFDKHSEVLKETQPEKVPEAALIDKQEWVQTAGVNGKLDEHEGVKESTNESQDKVAIKIKVCSNCNTRHLQPSCPLLGPLEVVEDAVSAEQWQLQSQVQVRCSVIESTKQKGSRPRKHSSSPSPTRDTETKTESITVGNGDGVNSSSFAEDSLPSCLSLAVVSPEHGKSVMACSPIAKYTRFGPLIGRRIHEKDISDESDMKHIWEVTEGGETFYISTDDPQKSNWLRFMRPAPTREMRNVMVVVRNKELFFITVAEISVGAELLFWVNDYGTPWAKKKVLKSSCGGCNMQFAHPLYYRAHCAVFHDPNHSLTIRKYHCKICGEAILGKENIMKHAAELHQGRGAYQCQYCDKFFLRLNYLEMHRTYGCAANPLRARPLCDYCGRKFCQPQKLKVHIKRMHSDINEVLREFQCKECLKLLGSRAALQRHLKEVHHREEIVGASSCERCGKTFTNRSNLKIHMLTHSGVKPFPCQEEGCKAAFTTKQCLQFHYKKVHGFTEDSLPAIKRAIAYTFESYAGGENNSETQAIERLERVERRGRKALSRKDQQNRESQQHNQSQEEQNMQNHQVHYQSQFSQATEDRKQVECQLQPLQQPLQSQQAPQSQQQQLQQQHHVQSQYHSYIVDNTDREGIQEQVKLRFPDTHNDLVLIHSEEQRQQEHEPSQCSRILTSENPGNEPFTARQEGIKSGQHEQHNQHELHQVRSPQVLPDDAPEEHLKLRYPDTHEKLAAENSESQSTYIDMQIHHPPHKQEILRALHNSESIQVEGVPLRTDASELNDYHIEPDAPQTHKVEADTSTASPPSSTSLHPLSYNREERSIFGNKTLTPLLTVVPPHTSPERYIEHHAPPHSPSPSPPSTRSASPNRGLRCILSKGSKKWLGEALEVAEEAAAAVMRLSPRLSPRVKRDIYDFDNDNQKSLPCMEDTARQDMQADLGFGRGLGASKVVSALSTFHRPESASMLVEAALDAAERDVDICCTMNSSTVDKSLNPSRRSPDSLHISHSDYRLNSPHGEQVYYTQDGVSVHEPEANLEHSHYQQVHSPESSPHVHHMDGYGIGMIHNSVSLGRRMYSLSHEQTHIQHDLIQQGSVSSDEEGGVMDTDCNSRSDGVQNLSLGSKDKTNLHMELPAMPAYSLSEVQGIDMSARSGMYHSSSQGHLSIPPQNNIAYSPSSTYSSSRYHVYDLETDCHTVDLSVANRNATASSYNHYGEMARSVDLSIPRNHAPSSLMSSQVSSSGHMPLSPSPPDYIALGHSHSSHIHLSHSHVHAGSGQIFAVPVGAPMHTGHPPAYQAPPLQRAQISSSSTPSPVPSPGSSQYHSYYI